MSQNTTIQAAETKNTDNYHAYESADDGETICVMSISVGAAEQLDSEFIEVELSDEEGTEVMLESSTKGYGKYRSAGGAVGPSQPLYVSRETLAEFSEGADEDDEAVPESIFVTLRPSDEETFEEAREAFEQEQAEEQEDEVESLVAGNSDDSDSDEDDEEDEEEIEIADEEVGLVE